MAVHRVRDHVILASLLGIASLPVGGCSELEFGPSALCCNEGDFQVGGTITSTAEYPEGVRITLQAVADVGGIASAAVSDLETSCRSIAEQLGAPRAEREAAQAIVGGRARMTAFCDLAASTIASARANVGGSLTIDVAPARCRASVSASADCNAGCQVDAACDASATPPTCEGGTMTVRCEGSCSAEAGASIQCQGACSGGCTGSCTAPGGVECAGRCEGTCKGAADGGTGQGIQADGTCQGTCEGTCAVTPPGVTCEGSCHGACDARCEAEAGASVTCDGTCEGEGEPLACEGGELVASCELDAECEASCEASVMAKAECTPPEVTVGFSGDVDVQAVARLRSVLEAHLGAVAALEVRFAALGEAVIAVSGNVSPAFLADIKAVCTPLVLAAVRDAVKDVEATTAASAVIMAEAGG